MTEVEWLAYSGDPQPMLKFLQSIGWASERKLRLFAVACCKLLFRKVRPSPRWVQEVDAAELYADGAITSVELQEAPRSTRYIHPEAELREVIGYSNAAAHHACLNTTEIEGGVIMADCAALNAAWGATQPGRIMPSDNGLSSARLVVEQAIQCELLRDIFVPFASAVLQPSWLVWNYGIVARLAQATYDERTMPEGTLDVIRMAILADALEEAGADQLLITHLRQPGAIHFRGCWVIDILLGKD